MHQAGGLAARSVPVGTLVLQRSSLWSSQRPSSQPQQQFSGAVISSPAQREQLFSWCLENTLSSSTVTA